MILSITRWTPWKFRNNKKYEGNDMNETTKYMMLFKEFILHIPLLQKQQKLKSIDDVLHYINSNWNDCVYKWGLKCWCGCLGHEWVIHYDDVIMGVIASLITSLTIVYSTFYSDVDQRKHQSSASLAFVLGNSPGTGEFPAQMASNAENVSIWWRHHVRPTMFCGMGLLSRPCDACFLALKSSNIPGIV